MLERTLTGQLEVAPLRLRVFVVCLFLIGTILVAGSVFRGYFGVSRRTPTRLHVA